MESVLDQIDAGNLPQIRVYNKIELAGEEPRIERNADGQVLRVWLSAMTGAGVDHLITALAEEFKPEMISGLLRLGADSPRLRARLFELGAVRDEQVLVDGSSELMLDMKKRDYNRLVQKGYAQMTDAFDEGACASEHSFLQSPARVAPA